MNSSFESYLLKLTGSSYCEQTEIIQSLWSGYGNISRFDLKGGNINEVVVKHITLSSASQHPRGWNTSKSHERKVKSYKVEQEWYKSWSHKCSESCKVPAFIGSFTEGENQWIVLEDLKSNYPLVKEHIDLHEVRLCLKWLANFHALFMNTSPNGIWNVGTYWHLETRPDELAKMSNKELKSKAYLIDELLNTCTYKTIVHGDAKLANFCFSGDGTAVAAVDFQYVGGGCGIKDVAYFLGSSLTGEECKKHESELLQVYFTEMRNVLKLRVPGLNFSQLENEWRSMYPLAVADFVRFLLGWMPNHHKLNSYSLDLTNKALSLVD